MSITPTNSQPIAVFDSGLGGLSVLKQLLRQLPHENFLYFGDSKNAPYGEKSAAEVRQLAEENIGNLIDRGAKAVVIACNTATSVAAHDLRQKYPEIPIIGMEPALKPAVEFQTRSVKLPRPFSADPRSESSLRPDSRPRVLVMATPLTIHEQKFRQLADQYRAAADLILVPCAGLAEAIETATPPADLRALLERLVGPYKNQTDPCQDPTAAQQSRIDAVVLGCTHYIHIKPLIASLFVEDVALFDGVDGTIRELTRRLAAQNLLNPSDDPGCLTLEFSSPDAPAKVALARQLLEN